MTNEKRIEIERRIVRKYIKALTDAGYKPTSISTGDDFEPYEEDMLFEADEALITFKHPELPNGSLYFVYGNQPGEVLNDYSVTLEKFVAPVNRYADQWA